MLLISDRRESVTTRNLVKGARRSRVLVAGVPGHGVELLPDKDVEDAIVGWLTGHLR